MKKESIPPVYSGNKLRIRLHVDSPHTHYGMPYASQTTTEMLAQLNSTEYKEEVFYINHTYRSVNVMGRNGLAVTIPYVSSCNNREFIIRKIIHLKNTSLKSAISCIQSMTDVDDAELQEIKRCLINTMDGYYNSSSIMIDYLVSVEEFKQKNNTLYHYQTDTVLSFDDNIVMDAHPYSSKFLNIGTFGITNDYSEQNELNVKLRYVNHNHNAAIMYTNIAGRVFKLFPQKDAPCKRLKILKPNAKATTIEYDDYVQLFYSSHCDPDVISTSGVTVVRMTIDEAKIKIGLYTNYNDALNSGNSELNRKEELAILMHNLELAKQENILERARIEKEEQVRKEELLKKEHLLEELKKSTLLEKARIEKEEQIRKVDLLRKEHELELLRKETTKLKQTLDLTSSQLNSDVLEQKRKQNLVDVKLNEINNEKIALEMRRKEQDEKIERERRMFNDKMISLREDHDHRMKQDSLYWKDYYENRSYRRKDTSEVVKFIPGLILGIGGILAVLIKTKQS